MIGLIILHEFPIYLIYLKTLLAENIIVDCVPLLHIRGFVPNLENFDFGLGTLKSTNEKCFRGNERNTYVGERSKVIVCKF